MKEIIQYFNEVCINELLKVSENLYRDPSKFAEYIEELKEKLYNIVKEIHSARFPFNDFLYQDFETESENMQ